ncbi:MAG: hypothetical protein EOR81_10830 [Mesorhizobium sp.]|nr:MAG: hypothetical protein EOR81_10830 [Mesorhizobium sp.]
MPHVHSFGGSSSKAVFRKAGCDIKGNINERGEYIYHMPGERWFCSRWEAWWAGWREAKV